MRKKNRKLKEECCSSRVLHKLDGKHDENAGGEDKISHLPEHILHHIFFFVDIKHAIQTTCLLSRRWRYFWGSLPTLKFIYNKSNRKTKFMDFVDRLLMFRSSNSNIHEFVLDDSCCYNNLTDRLNTWILASVICNVQQLTLRTHFPQKFRFHHSLFTCKSLTKLVVDAKLNCVSLLFQKKICVSLSLPRLKTLSLTSVQFEAEDSTNQLFSGCPILESLTMTSCKFPHHINVNISSPKLQHLILSGCRTTSNALDLGLVLETNFQLCAPNLISFHWNNSMSIHCAPRNLSSLVKADISTHVNEEKKAMHAPFMVNFFRGLHNVEDLKLTAAVLEVITGVPDLLDSQPTKFGNLRYLKLNGLLSRDCLYAIAYILKISPKIENISFMLHLSCSNDKMHLYWNPDEITSNSAKRGDCWKAGWSFEGLLNHLKCFELHNVTGRINELEFIEILLKNAMLLEELVISLWRLPYPAKEKELEERRLAKFSEKVLTFPKASSSNVVIMFKYVGYY